MLNSKVEGTKKPIKLGSYKSDVKVTLLMRMEPGLEYLVRMEKWGKDIRWFYDFWKVRYPKLEIEKITTRTIKSGILRHPATIEFEATKNKKSSST